VSTETTHIRMEARWQQGWVEPSEASRAVRMPWYFTFFLISGFCSILYELIWLRLAMAQFGVTTAMVSIVLSTFMAGLGLGSWAAGYLIRKHVARLTYPPLRLYAMTELFIACSAAIVPLELQAGRFLLERLGGSLSLSSFGYYLAAGLWLAFSLVPWCACMGATIPLAMFAIRNDQSLESRRSFSFLYLANVLGAVAGALIPLLLIEVFGFTSTLRFGMALNLAIFAAAFVLTRKSTLAPGSVDARESFVANNPGVGQTFAGGTLWLLFFTGLTSMGMEVVWTRQFTPYVGTFVYSFASILAVYLGSTFIGSSVYRVWSRRHDRESVLVWLGVWFASLLPLLAADPRVGLSGSLRVPLGIGAFSGLLGFLTPMLVDRFSQGDPDRAGLGYAVNVAGCILGPLLAGFLLLPSLGERHALLILALPWFIVGFPIRRSQATPWVRQLLAPNTRWSYLLALASLGLVFGTQTFEQQFPGAQIRRDSTATVIAAGTGMEKQLFVNGIGMTKLTPITKLMAALPLAFLDHQPQNALVICFGMGTTHRSVLSWGIDSTAVDLVPSVPKLFWYYHADGGELLKSPRSHVVIDDGRRFLERTSAQFDVIVIDPPPPIYAAGTSLLYSREFYAVAKKRLRPGGILQQWIPGGDTATTASVARALNESFPYVRGFVSVEGWGVHMLASEEPIPNRSAADLANRMPSSARTDLVEFGPFPSADQEFAAVLKNEIPITRIVAQNVYAPAMQDDRPVNEYYLLREVGAWLYQERWNQPQDPSK
jgi:spermidine synthase